MGRETYFWMTSFHGGGGGGGAEEKVRKA